MAGLINLKITHRLLQRNRPEATNFSLGTDVSFRGEAEVGRAAEPAASVEKKTLTDLERVTLKSAHQCRSFMAVLRLQMLGADLRS
jgi:hypothetical protein